MKRIFLTVLFFGVYILGSSQPTSAEERMRGHEQRMQLKSSSLVDGLPFTNIGPTVFSGRVTDIEVNPVDPTHFYVAYASGGLWFTNNNGTTFKPLFDEEMVMTIGDIAVDWSNNVIWVGTGESNSSRSSYAGYGVYRSDDGGATWTHRGLEETHHIGRILIDPADSETVLVAACGRLYGPNPERGIYRTTDGGALWEQVLYVDDQTGGIDLLYDPQDEKTVFAAMWQRERKAWDFLESGAGSGIYKSQDGGVSWRLLTEGKSGFPEGAGVGRIGLTAAVQDGKTHLFALLDNYDRRPAEEQDEDDHSLTKDELRDMDAESFEKLTDARIQSFLDQYRFPDKYSVESVRNMVAQGEIKPIALVEYVEDANSLLFDTPVKGAEVYHSDDEGKSWKRTHDEYIDYLYNSYGYYFGQIRAHPSDPDKLYILGVLFLRSDDRGKTWMRASGPNVHSDHQALWVNPIRPGHLINGNDGGLNMSYDDGENWSKLNTPAVGQFYAIAIDRAKPYNVYGGTQDNGVWKGPSTYQPSVRWHGSGHYPYTSILGGDGMQVQVDWRDNNTVYTGFQFGNYFRVKARSGTRKRISPKHDLGERPLRYNWETPIHLSRHNQDILYMGSNKLHRSMNQGDDWISISGDLTQGGRKGDVAYGTLTSIDESPLQFGLLYVGSDDGLVHCSQDGGVSWHARNDDLPRDLWVAQLVASEHELGRVYLALNGYRNDDFRAYLYQSEDYGQSWSPIGHDLPTEPVNTICEDPVNDKLLYVGTDHGIYISLDGGASFQTADSRLPNVAIHDLIVHPDENELVVGTHGRSIFTADVTPLQEMTEDVVAKDLHVFEIPSMRHSNRWGSKQLYRDEPYMKPTMDITVYSSKDHVVSFQVLSSEELVIAEGELKLIPGLNYVTVMPTVTKNTDTYRSHLKDQLANFSWKAPDDGLMYFHPGTYTFVIGDEEQNFTIKGGQSGRARGASNASPSELGK